MNKENLQQEQIALVNQLIIPDADNGYKIMDGDLIFTFDIQYEGDQGYVAADVLAWPDQPVGLFTQVYEATVPYEPGYFAFREGPLLLQALNELCKYRKIKPSLMIIDGHGTAHPRRLGVASWLGIKSDIPAIGVAKDPLLKKEYDVGMEKGDYTAIHDNEELVGYVLRTREAVKPVYVSSGHLISQKAAMETILGLVGSYRIIDSIRRADQFARRFSKGEWPAGWSDQVPNF